MLQARQLLALRFLIGMRPVAGAEAVLVSTNQVVVLVESMLMGSVSLSSAWEMNRVCLILGIPRGHADGTDGVCAGAGGGTAGTNTRQVLRKN